MRKIKLTLFAALIAVSFAACDDKKAKTESTDDANTEKVEQKQEEAPAASNNEQDKFLADYESLINRTLEIMEKAAKGDMDAVQESQKLAQDAQEFATKAQEVIPNFSAEQMKKYEEITKKYTDAIMSMSGQ